MAQTDDRAGRVRLLLALEIDRIVHDVDARVEFLLQIWSRYRRRDAFVDTLYSRWRTVGFAELAELSTDAILAVQRFYDDLDGFRLYLAHTEDMPMTLRDQYAVWQRRLARSAGPALEALGGAPERSRPTDLPDVPLDAPDAP